MRHKLLSKMRFLGLIFFVVIMVAAIMAFSATRKVTLTTYYPAPYGKYNDLQSKTLTVSDRVGIGTTNPQAPLHVIAKSDGDGAVPAAFVGKKLRIVGPVPDHRAYLTFQHQDIIDDGDVDWWGLAIDPTTKSFSIHKSAFRDFITLTDKDDGNGKVLLNPYPLSGNVGIGTASPQEKLHINGKVVIGPVLADGRTNDMLTLSHNNGPFLVFKRPGGRKMSMLWDYPGAPYAPGRLVFFDDTDGGTTPFTFDFANDRFGIATLSPSYKLEVAGDSANDTGVWATLSDIRLKRNILPIQDALSTITQLQGVTFNWKNPKRDAEYGLVRGFVAQDLEKVVPEWVKLDKEGYKWTEPIGIDAVIIEAIKELKVEKDKQDEVLKQENILLKKELVSLKEEITTLKQAVVELRSIAGK